MDEINQLSAERCFPDGDVYSGISADSVSQISNRNKISRLRVEMKALEMNIIPERYVRNMKSFSASDQAKLLGSEVSVVGLGGLGGTVTEILARIGIGGLNVIDGESFEESNLNRQLLSTQSLLGRSKAEAAWQRIRDINPSVIVKMHPVHISEENAAALLKDSDVAVDCLDNLRSRFVLEHACRTMGIPMVSAAIAGDAGQVITVFPEDPGLRLIYGEADHMPSRGAELRLGCLPYIVTLISSLECAEVVKILLSRGSVLRNKLLIADLTDHAFEIMKL
jgi:molybdopterin/thiamine biosynthesis adenylyltransferase